MRIVIVALCFFSNILFANEQEPRFCENGMELIVVVRTAHCCLPIGDCRDWETWKNNATEREEREDNCRANHPGLFVEVKPGNGDAKRTNTIPPWVDSSNGVFRYDAVWTDSAEDESNFIEYEIDGIRQHYSGRLEWTGITEDNLEMVEFSFNNDNQTLEPSYILDVRPYKSLDTVGRAVLHKWNTSCGWVQLTADVVVKCTLEACDNRLPVDGSVCSSVLDVYKCYSLTYSLSGSETETHCSTTCPVEIFQVNDETGNCELKKCTERSLHEDLHCGSSDCYPDPTDRNDTSCSTSCPPFFSRGAGVCEVKDCGVRDPISGVCSWDEKNEENAKCGYLRNEILCKECSEKIYTAINGVCILKPCTERKIINEGTQQYVCGDGSCLGQPDDVNCDTTCPSINYAADARGQCTLKKCCLRTPMVKRFGKPCDSNDCFLQPFKDVCADSCPGGYTENTDSGVCVPDECSVHTSTLTTAAVLAQSSSSNTSRSQIRMHTHTNSVPVTYFPHEQIEIRTDMNTHTGTVPVTLSNTNAGGTPQPSTSFTSNNTNKKKNTHNHSHTHKHNHSHTHTDPVFRYSRTSSNAPHTYAGPAFCVEDIAVDINVSLVHLDNNMMNTRVSVTIGDEEKTTEPVKRGDNDYGVYWDADFLNEANINTTNSFLPFFALFVIIIIYLFITDHFTFLFFFFMMRNF